MQGFRRSLATDLDEKLARRIGSLSLVLLLLLPSAAFAVQVVAEFNAGAASLTWDGTSLWAMDNGPGSTGTTP